MTLQIPSPPAILPEKFHAKWREDYEREFTDHAERQFASSAPGEPLNFEALQARDRQMAHQLGLRRANRVLATPKTLTLEQAKALEDWQVIFRDTVNEVSVPYGKPTGRKVFTVITIDGKKHRFPQQ